MFKIKKMFLLCAVVGSTNHTYLNDGMIPSNQEVRLNDGDKVKFANEEYKFMIG